MKIAIEAQRIFRSDKHGMDFVILETLKEMQKRKDGNHYYLLVSAGEDLILYSNCRQTCYIVHPIQLRCGARSPWY